VTRWYRLSPFYWLARWRVRRIVKRWSFNATVSEVLARRWGPDYVPMVASAMTDLIRKKDSARPQSSEAAGGGETTVKPPDRCE